MGKKLIPFLLTLVIALFFTNKAFAVTTPDFPDCSNPSGNVIASYDSGLHAIVGDPVMHEGKDTVYELSSSTLLQCFCAPDNNGIQTNWWQASTLTADEIQIMKNQGWYYIPDGLSWGLQNGFYLAVNKNYSCGAVNTTPTPTIPPEITPTPGIENTPTPTPTTQITTSIGTPSDNGDKGGGYWSCPDPAPLAPNLFSLINLGGGKINLKWTAVSPVSHYGISYGLSSGNYIYGQTDIGNTTDYTVGSLTDGQKYCFVVNAVNNCASSPFSNELCSGQVLGGQVLGLSSTGSNSSGLIFLGLGCVLLGIRLKKSFKV